MRLRKSHFPCCSGIFFALASYCSQLSLLCLPAFLSSFSDLWKWSWTRKVMQMQGLKPSICEWQDKMRWVFSLLAPGTPPRVAYLRHKSPALRRLPSALALRDVPCLYLWRARLFQATHSVVLSPTCRLSVRQIAACRSTVRVVGIEALYGVPGMHVRIMWPYNPLPGYLIV